MTTLHIAMALLACMTVAAVGRGQPVVLQTGLSDRNGSGFLPVLSGDGGTIASVDRSHSTGGGYPWFWRTSSVPGIKTRLTIPVGTEFGFVNAISHDGRYVFGHVGRSNTDAGNMAIRWNTIDGTYVALPPPGDFVFWTFCRCSDDGETAVALAVRLLGPQTFSNALILWSSVAGFEEIPLPLERRTSGLPTISGDGQVIVTGTSTNANTVGVMRWSRQTGWIPLGVPAHSSSWVSDLGTSFNGEAIIATFRHNDNVPLNFSVRWDWPSTQPQIPILDRCANRNHYPRLINFISRDGSRMIGSSIFPDESFYWLPGRMGVRVGWMFDHMYRQPQNTFHDSRATGMSADGLTIMTGYPWRIELVSFSGTTTFPDMLDHGVLDHRRICDSWAQGRTVLAALPRPMFCDDPLAPMQWYRYLPGTDVPQAIPDQNSRFLSVDNSTLLLPTIAGRYFMKFGDLQTPDYHVGCIGDYDCTLNGLPNMADLFRFLNDWFAGGFYTDIDDDGAILISDVYAFIHEWFRGCEMTTP